MRLLFLIFLQGSRNVAFQIKSKNQIIVLSESFAKQQIQNEFDFFLPF